MQRLGAGSKFAVETSTYAVKVGMDIDVYILGRKDWSELVDKISLAFQEQVQNDMLSAVINVECKLPAKTRFMKNFAIEAANKTKFDELVADVSAINGGVGVTIFGLKTDLQKLKAFADVDWATEDQKKDMATLGRLGSYEGTALFELPNKFAKNDPTLATKIIQPGKLYIMPNVDNKFVKFIDEGETEITEVSEKGARVDDLMTYEVKRSMGVATIMDRYFGVLTITE